MRHARLLVPLVVGLAACKGDQGTGPADLPGRLAFVSDRRLGQFDIYLVNADGSGVRLLDSSYANDIWPTWSPDGRFVAYQSDRVLTPADTVPHDNIYVIGADGTGVLALTSDTLGNIQPAWSPDGTKIAFATKRDGNYEIYTMDTGGGNLLRLTNDPGEDGQPAWSPDGSKIAFASDRSGNADLYVMNAADGSNVVDLTSNAATDLGPAWSPDGTKIAFSSDRSGQSEIWVMDANGANPVRRSGGRAPAELPAWSPTGDRLAYDSDADIWLIFADGTGAQRITKQLASDFNPRWQP
jgi:Tol biopolymer transport system component